MRRSIVLLLLVTVALVAASCKVTGGGWITLDDGSKATFSFTYQCEDGLAKGKFTYHDPAADVKVRGTFLENNACGEAGEGDPFLLGATYVPQPKKAGDGGSAILSMVDNGEPGGEDTFFIKLVGGLYDGYEAFGVLGGGNIQAH